MGSLTGGSSRLDFERCNRYAIQAAMWEGWQVHACDGRRIAAVGMLTGSTYRDREGKS